MRAIVIDEVEFKRAFEESLLRIEKALRENPRETPEMQFRTVNYYVHELRQRLESK